MKFFICSSIIILVLLLSGCTEKEAELPIERKPVAEETIAPAEVHTEGYSEPIKKDDKSSAADDSLEDVLFTYAEKYETEYRFTDLYISAKCWLVGKENIVEIISVGGIDDVTIMEQKAVERVEHLNIGEFTTISVFDKTGQSISIMVSPEDAGKLLDLIEQN